MLKSLISNKLPILILVRRRYSFCSLKPSPNKLKPKIVRSIDSPGNNPNHQATPKVDFDSAKIFPQLGDGGWTPRPKKLKDDSNRIARSEEHTSELQSQSNLV